MTISLNGRPVRYELARAPRKHGAALIIDLGLGDVGLGVWPGDLLAYRQEWDPFVLAHARMWRDLNTILEAAPSAKKCPTGIFDANQVAQTLDSATRAYCASLALSRMYISDTHPLGIMAQWNAWKNRSSAEIVAGAAEMLAWHQDVVMRVGGPYKNTLEQIGKLWALPISLPDLPTFTTQQAIRASIEGAYITAKGVVQIVGYQVGKTLTLATGVTEALAAGLTDSARDLPKTVSRVAIAIGVTATLVGGVLLVYYVPRVRKTHSANAPA